MTSEVEHRYRVESVTSDHCVAVCSCGWRSEPVTNPGMAGGAFDRHKVEVDESET